MNNQTAILTTKLHMKTRKLNLTRLFLNEEVIVLKYTVANTLYYYFSGTGSNPGFLLCSPGSTVLKCVPYMIPLTQYYILLTLEVNNTASIT